MQFVGTSRVTTDIGATTDPRANNYTLEYKGAATDPDIAADMNGSGIAFIAMTHVRV
jgi:hypothetical protein